MDRVSRWGIAVVRFVRSAPLTYIWLVILLVTTRYVHSLPRQARNQLLLDSSTNLRNLFTQPVHVLFASLFWLDGKYWWYWFPYLVLFTLFLAPAERWLGQRRWLTVGLTAHVVATFISEGAVYLEIHNHFVHHRLAKALVDSRDIGVSYFLVGVAAVLAYHIAPPWRWGYLGLLILVCAAALFIGPSFKMHVIPGFTAIGHFSAIFVGLCFYRMARRRDGPRWRPKPVRLARTGV